MSRPGRNKRKANGKPPARKHFLSKWFPFLFFLMAFFLYINTINFGYVLDDSIYTTGNKYVQKGISSFFDMVGKGTLYGFDGSNTADYRPLVLMNFAFEKTLFGNSSTVNHFINIFIYALLCALLFTLLRRLFIDFPVYVPLIIAALFVLHPLHTEVVANIKSRDELLCLLFGLITMHYVLKYEQSKKTLFLSLGCSSFVLCLLSKENGFAFLGLIPLILFFFTEASIKRISLVVMPFILAAGAVMLLRLLILDSLFINNGLLIINNSLMAATSIGDRFATCFTILLYALKLLFFPVHLSWDYSYNTFPIVGWKNALPVFSLLIHLVLLFIALSYLRKKNIFSFAILFYFISYFITSNLVIPIGSSFAERFLFTPSLAFCIVMPFLLARILKIDLKTTSASGAKWLIGILLLVSLLYIFRTVDRNAVWKDSQTLDASGIETAPNSARTHYAYADDYKKMFTKSDSPEEKKKLAKIALTEYQKSLDIYNRDNTINSDIYFNMGMIIYSMGDAANGISLIEKAISFNPKSTEVLYNLGLIYLDRKDYALALHYLMTASVYDPQNADILGYIGLCYQNMKNYSTSIKYYEKALMYKPSYVNIMINLSRIYYELGDTIKALRYREQASKF